MAKKEQASKQQDKISQVTKRLEQGIVDFLSGNQYQNYLKVMSRFHNYSYSNSLLIAMQRPNATYLAGYSGWQKKFKRHVLPGEHGIKIFAPAPVKKIMEKERLDPDTNLPVLDENGDPVKDQVEVKLPMFKVVTVFDVTQTEGEPLPKLGINDLTGKVPGYEDFLKAIRQTATVPLDFDEIDGESHGYFSPSEQRIVIKEGMSEAQTLKTAVHELTHSRLHNIEQEPGRQKHSKKDRNTAEVVAESVAFVVCDHFCLDTSDYSFGYVGTWSSGKELPELKASLQTIRSAANEIITELESHLTEIQREHTQSITHEQEKSQAREPDGKDPYHKHNFQILPTNRDTFAVYTESEHPGIDAIVYESVSRKDCVDYIAQREEPKEWKFYIIPDLKTWAHGQSKQPPTALEHYDTLSQATARFRELRTNAYNTEESIIPGTGRSHSRLTLGIEGVNIPSAVDVIHVEAGKNVLCEDFTRLSAFNTDRNALAAISAVTESIQIDQVNHYHAMTPEEIKAFTLTHLLDKLHREGVDDTSSVEAGFDAYYESGGADYLKPSQSQRESYELIPFSEWDNPYFETKSPTAVSRTPDEQLAADLARFCREYDPFIFDDSGDGNDKLASNILEDLRSGSDQGIRTWLQQVINADDEDSRVARPLMERVEEQFPLESTPKQEATISFYAAECMEFSHVGKFQDHLTLEEALAVYDSIPPERLKGIPCVGFHLQDGSIYEGDYPLMYGGKIDREGINLVEHYKDSPLVQKAISDLQTILDSRAAEQERSTERAADPSEICYQISSMYLHIQEASDGSWDYTLYGNQMNEIDGGQIGDSATPLSEVRDGILSELAYDRKKLIAEIPMETFEQMLADKEQNLKCSIFPKTLQEVFGTPEMETWRICHQANCACKEQFDKEYGAAYHARQVPEFLQKMVDRYGSDRCKLVLASTIQLATHDGRYYPDIKEAAAKVNIPGATNDHHDVRRAYQVTCHPVMVNAAFRDLLAMEQPKQELSGQDHAQPTGKKETKRPSVRKKLKAKQEAITAAEKKPPGITHNKNQLE